MARGAIKVVSINGPLTVTFTAASGTTPTVFSDEACTTTTALPATVNDGATTTFYFASPGSYTLSVKTSGGIQIAGDLNSTKPVTVFAGDVGVYAYDARLVAKDFSGDSGRHSPATDLSAAYEAGSTTIVYCDPSGSDSNSGALRSAAKATLTAALAALPSGIGVVRLTPGASYVMGVGDSFTLDAAKVRIEGTGAILQWNAAPTAGFAVKITSTGTYSTRYNQWKTVLDGIVIRGQLGAPLAGVGLIVGDSGATDVSNFRLADGGVEGFATCIQLASNAWRVHFDQFNARNGSTASLSAATGLTNFNELWQFSHCMFEGAVTLGTGEYHFIGCSFDNAALTNNGDCIVYCTDCHFENPTSATVARFVSLTDGNAGVMLDNCQVIINAKSGGGAYDLCAFYCDAVVVNRGLILRNLNIPQTANYAPETGTDAFRGLVAGTGRVEMDGVIQNQNFSAYSIAAACNRAYNGGAESNNTSGWTVTGTASTIDTVTFRSAGGGTKSFKYAPAASASTLMQQKAPCRPGQWVSLTGWYNISSFGTGSSGNVQIIFQSADGTQTGSAGFSSMGATGGWTLYKGSGVAPAGTAQAVVSILGASGTGLFVGNFDDFNLAVA